MRQDTTNHAGVYPAQDKHKKWIILGVIYICVLAYTVTPQTISPVLNLIMSNMNLSHTGLGYGIMATAQNICVLVGPATVGLMRDATGSYQGSYLLMAFFAILVTVTMIVFSINSRQTRRQSLPARQI
jgi:predicted MFS family arabinose efflux permease